MLDPRTRNVSSAFATITRVSDDDDSTVDHYCDSKHCDEIGFCEHTVYSLIVPIGKFVLNTIPMKEPSRKWSMKPVTEPMRKGARGVIMVQKVIVAIHTTEDTVMISAMRLRRQDG